MNLEVRKPIPGYDGYEVSSWGNVYKDGKPVHQDVHCKGYLRVDLFNEDGRKHMKVHRLVAEAFIPNPEGKPQINHIDGNNQNNSVTNLEWVTDGENKDHAKILRSVPIVAITEDGVSMFGFANNPFGVDTNPTELDTEFMNKPEEEE